MARKDYSLRKRFGISASDYDAVLSLQGGGCAICGDKETAVDKRTGRKWALAVDHCHSTGTVRGLLCSACNQAIGKFKDDPALLRKAAAYVERFQNRQVDQVTGGAPGAN